MRPIFARRPRAEWLAALATHDVASAEINTIPETMRDEEVRHLELFESAERPTYGAMTMMRRAARINGARLARQLMPPLLGEHTDAVLRELGYDDAAIAAFRQATAI